MRDLCGSSAHISTLGYPLAIYATIIFVQNIVYKSHDNNYGKQGIHFDIYREKESVRETEREWVCERVKDSFGWMVTRTVPSSSTTTSNFSDINI